MNPNTVLPHVANKDAGELIDPLSLDQEIHDPTDPVFEGIELPGDGIINIYDDTIFRSSVLRKFENNENYAVRSRRDGSARVHRAQFYRDGRERATRWTSRPWTRSSCA
jgi:hypothetical protein